MKKISSLALATAALNVSPPRSARSELPRQRARRIEGGSAAPGLLRRPKGQLGGRWVRHRVSRQWTDQASDSATGGQKCWYVLDVQLCE